MSEPWQNVLSTWRNKVSYLHGKEYMSDCWFILENCNKKIPAHKFVLASSSTTFFHLFFISKNFNEIIVRNVSFEALESFIYYLYNETTNLTLETLWDILKMTKIYSIKSLERFCDDFLVKILNQENVSDILDYLSKFNLPKSDAKCGHILTTTNVKFETLEKWLNLKSYPGNEAEIYRAINQWAEERCKNDNCAITAKNKRFSLNGNFDKYLQLIKFERMAIQEFYEFTVGRNSMLTKNEIIEIYRNIIINSNEGVGSKIEKPAKTVEKSKLKELFSEVNQIIEECSSILYTNALEIIPSSINELVIKADSVPSSLEAIFSTTKLTTEEESDSKDILESKTSVGKFVSESNIKPEDKPYNNEIKSFVMKHEIHSITIKEEVEVEEVDEEEAVEEEEEEIEEEVEEEVEVEVEEGAEEGAEEEEVEVEEEEPNLKDRLEIKPIESAEYTSYVNVNKTTEEPKPSLSNLELLLRARLPSSSMKKSITKDGPETKLITKINETDLNSKTKDRKEVLLKPDKIAVTEILSIEELKPCMTNANETIESLKSMSSTDELGSELIAILRLSNIGCSCRVSCSGSCICFKTGRVCYPTCFCRGDCTSLREPTAESLLKMGVNSNYLPKIFHLRSDNIDRLNTSSCNCKMSCGYYCVCFRYGNNGCSTTCFCRGDCSSLRDPRPESLLRMGENSNYLPKIFHLRDVDQPIYSCSCKVSCSGNCGCFRRSIVCTWACNCCGDCSSLNAPKSESLIRMGIGHSYTTTTDNRWLELKNLERLGVPYNVCGCEASCSGRCGCFKLGFACVSVCKCGGDCSSLRNPQPESLIKRSNNFKYQSNKCHLMKSESIKDLDLPNIISLTELDPFNWLTDLLKGCNDNFQSDKLSASSALDPFSFLTIPLNPPENFHLRNNVCGCKVSCSGNCGCFKKGIACTSACNCRGNCSSLSSPKPQSLSRMSNSLNFNSSYDSLALPKMTLSGRCGCKVSCSGNCGCFKKGIACTSACNCRGNCSSLSSPRPQSLSRMSNSLNFITNSYEYMPKMTVTVRCGCKVSCTGRCTCSRNNVGCNSSCACGGYCY